MYEHLLEYGKPLPEITPGEELLATPNFKVVTDYKPGLEGKREGERFFIEPRTPQSLSILWDAAMAHNIYNFNLRPIENFHGPGNYLVPSLRADYSRSNLPALFLGVTEIPKVGKDTIPSPQRMETCVRQAEITKQNIYTFGEGFPKEFAMRNYYTRHLKIMKETSSDEIPNRIIHSNDLDSYYKVRKNWWAGLTGTIEGGLMFNEFTDLDIIPKIEKFLSKYVGNREFFDGKHLTTADQIVEANEVIDLIWQKYGNI